MTPLNLVVNKLLELTNEEQEQIIKIFEKRARIVSWYKAYEERKQELAAELSEIQSKCEHIALKSSKSWHEDEYGKQQDYGWWSYSCPDCSKYWVEEWPEKK